MCIIAGYSSFPVIFRIDLNTSSYIGQIHNSFTEKYKIMIHIFEI